MRIVAGFVIAAVAALAVAACDTPRSTATLEPVPSATRAPSVSLPLPASSVRPGRPSPSIEIPPPID